MIAEILIGTAIYSFSKPNRNAKKDRQRKKRRQKKSMQARLLEQERHRLKLSQEKLKRFRDTQKAWDKFSKMK